MTYGECSTILHARASWVLWVVEPCERHCECHISGLVCVVEPCERHCECHISGLVWVVEPCERHCECHIGGLVCVVEPCERHCECHIGGLVWVVEPCERHCECHISGLLWVVEPCERHCECHIGGLVWVLEPCERHCECRISGLVWVVEPFDITWVVIAMPCHRLPGEVWPYKWCKPVPGRHINPMFAQHDHPTRLHTLTLCSGSCAQVKRALVAMPSYSHNTTFLVRSYGMTKVYERQFWWSFKHGWAVWESHMCWWVACQVFLSTCRWARQEMVRSTLSVRMNNGARSRHEVQMSTLSVRMNNGARSRHEVVMSWIVCQDEQWCTVWTWGNDKCIVCQDERWYMVPDTRLW